MRRMPMFIIVLLLSASTLLGCSKSQSFFYAYDELIQNFERAEIIYMESEGLF